MDESVGILITGGTGSFGRSFVRTVLNRLPNIRRLVVFSRDELKQSEMALEYPREHFPGLRFFLGDVRDQQRLYQALEGIDIVIHAAALKQVPAAEYNPFEFVKTNVLGSENLVRACLERRISRVIALSTDKAAAPLNLYGATKLCSDKLILSANNIRGDRPTIFSVVRYGNVLGSRGSVIPFFLSRRSSGTLPITHPDMTRFSISLVQGVELVWWAIVNAIGGEIFVPKIPSYRILDVANAIGPECHKTVVGLRPGEKIHEEMITASDSFSTIDLGKIYAILSQSSGLSPEAYIESTMGKPVEDGFSYNSRDNTHFLSISDIRELIKEHVDESFSV
jgi:UDP-N-acetylglucosamine 4,6-dehydratase